MIDSVLVVCVGNICRSPVGARVLSAYLAQSGVRIAVDSAGLNALEGEGTDNLAAEVAKAHIGEVGDHIAQRFTPALGQKHSLILVMEPGHKRELARGAPELSGRVMLFDQWSGAQGIPDPYRRDRAFHERVFAQIDAGARGWASRIALAGEVRP